MEDKKNLKFKDIIDLYNLNDEDNEDKFHMIFENSEDDVKELLSKIKSSLININRNKKLQNRFKIISDLEANDNNLNYIVEELLTLKVLSDLNDTSVKINKTGDIVKDGVEVETSLKEKITPSKHNSISIMQSQLNNELSKKLLNNQKDRKIQTFILSGKNKTAKNVLIKKISDDMKSDIIEIDMIYYTSDEEINNIFGSDEELSFLEKLLIKSDNKILYFKNIDKAPEGFFDRLDEIISKRKLKSIDLNNITIFLETHRNIENKEEKNKLLKNKNLYRNLNRRNFISFENTTNEEIKNIGMFNTGKKEAIIFYNDIKVEYDKSYWDYIYFIQNKYKNIEYKKVNTMIEKNIIEGFVEPYLKKRNLKKSKQNIKISFDINKSIISIKNYNEVIFEINTSKEYYDKEYNFDRYSETSLQNNITILEKDLKLRKNLVSNDLELSNSLENIYLMDGYKEQKEILLKELNNKMNKRVVSVDVSKFKSEMDFFKLVGYPLGYSNEGDFDEDELDEDELNQNKETVDWYKIDGKVPKDNSIENNLLKFIIDNPNSTLIFENIEKLEGKLQEFLEVVTLTGKYVMNDGKIIDFKNTMIVLDKELDLTQEIKKDEIDEYKKSRKEETLNGSKILNDKITSLGFYNLDLKTIFEKVKIELINYISQIYLKERITIEYSPDFLIGLIESAFSQEDGLEYLKDEISVFIDESLQSAKRCGEITKGSKVKLEFNLETSIVSSNNSDYKSVYSTVDTHLDKITLMNKEEKEEVRKKREYLRDVYDDKVNYSYTISSEYKDFFEENIEIFEKYMKENIVEYQKEKEKYLGYIKANDKSNISKYKEIYTSLSKSENIGKYINFQKTDIDKSEFELFLKFYSSLEKYINEVDIEKYFDFIKSGMSQLEYNEWKLQDLLISEYELYSSKEQLKFILDRSPNVVKNIQDPEKTMREIFVLTRLLETNIMLSENLSNLFIKNGTSIRENTKFLKLASTNKLVEYKVLSGVDIDLYIEYIKFFNYEVENIISFEVYITLKELNIEKDRYEKINNILKNKVFEIDFLNNKSKEYIEYIEYYEYDENILNKIDFFEYKILIKYNLLENENICNQVKNGNKEICVLFNNYDSGDLLNIIEYMEILKYDLKTKISFDKFKEFKSLKDVLLKNEYLLKDEEFSKFIDGDFKKRNTLETNKNINYFVETKNLKNKGFNIKNKINTVKVLSILNLQKTEKNIDMIQNFDLNLFLEFLEIFNKKEKEKESYDVLNEYISIIINQRNKESSDELIIKYEDYILYNNYILIKENISEKEKFSFDIYKKRKNSFIKLLDSNDYDELTKFIVDNDSKIPKNMILTIEDVKSIQSKNISIKEYYKNSYVEKIYNKIMKKNDDYIEFDEKYDEINEMYLLQKSEIESYKGNTKYNITHRDYFSYLLNNDGALKNKLKLSEYLFLFINDIKFKNIEEKFLKRRKYINKYKEHLKSLDIQINMNENVVTQLNILLNISSFDINKFNINDIKYMDKINKINKDNMTNRKNMNIEIKNMWEEKSNTKKYKMLKEIKDEDLNKNNKLYEKCIYIGGGSELIMFIKNRLKNDIGMVEIGYFLQNICITKNMTTKEMISSYDKTISKKNSNTEIYSYFKYLIENKISLKQAPIQSYENIKKYNLLLKKINNGNPQIDSLDSSSFIEQIIKNPPEITKDEILQLIKSKNKNSEKIKNKIFDIFKNKEMFQNIDEYSEGNMDEGVVDFKLGVFIKKIKSDYDLHTTKEYKELVMIKINLYKDIKTKYKEIFVKLSIIEECDEISYYEFCEVMLVAENLGIKKNKKNLLNLIKNKSKLKFLLSENQYEKELEVFTNRHGISYFSSTDKKFTKHLIKEYKINSEDDSMVCLK